MCENNLTKRRTPLRNSNSANKPFRSPLTTVVTPKNNESPKNAVCQSPMQKTATPKRSLSQFRHPIKRRRIDAESLPSNESPSNESTNNELVYSDFLAIKRRIRNKRQELDNLKTKSNYIKKHNRDDLVVQIDKWRTACKDALFQFHKDIREKTSESLSMGRVLSMLGIPEDVVKFTPEECDLT